MADRYLRFTGTAPGRFLTRRLGLPQPAALTRWSPERPALDGGLLHLTAGRSALGPAPVLARTGIGPAGSGRAAAVVLDATGVRDVEALAEVHAALHPVVRSVAPSGRVVVLGAPLDPADHHQAAAQQALEGFTRSLGKEIGRGRTVNLVRLTDAGAAESTLRFLLSPKSAYVSGQVIEVGAPQETAPPDADRPLTGRTALVTGAARGIGEAVAETLARDGARVVVLDVPQAGQDARRVAERLGGTALLLDMTSADAGARIAEALPDGLDLLIHNAGITRDRRLVNMPSERWISVLEVNLASVLRTTDALLKDGTLKRGGRIVATASIAGLAGNAGQTNYGASKAGVVGLVRSLAPRALEEHGVTVNAVAPGFIETKMTAAVPLFIREAGRRMNSLAQGGLPVDVAETTAWLAHPASGAVNGQVVRVCGQSLLGA
ncbi:MULTISPECIES: 3-oxoacyl-ACP reductase [Streptomyces]|uniref:3-oxoacyl-[acyl-carrier protein] reductase n=2 Tax=Streptomyces TaxID=1883 RepID=A0AA89QBE9_STRCU|nr:MULTISPECIES: 3-oxoacyl-ACP reductase [Streptomyces]MBB5813020.1 3-oxoacyl-[acyl-carrier protein] reductase [Streptomyces collinus]MEC7055912.1 3-oxoacyl-ACP reductase [Streptomyces violaceochromogenes]WMX66144.1 3-oxoacyl-ACP reductase [Streptomyces collinus]GHC69761.1 3-oxoacyl-ACP reductase [Streptomyces violaceochromogenes]